MGGSSESTGPKLKSLFIPSYLTLPRNNNMIPSLSKLEICRILDTPSLTSHMWWQAASPTTSTSPNTLLLSILLPVPQLPSMAWQSETLSASLPSGIHPFLLGIFVKQIPLHFFFIQQIFNDASVLASPGTLLAPGDIATNKTVLSCPWMSFLKEFKN